MAKNNAGIGDASYTSKRLYLKEEKKPPFYSDRFHKRATVIDEGQISFQTGLSQN